MSDISNSVVFVGVIPRVQKGELHLLLTLYDVDLQAVFPACLNSRWCSQERTTSVDWTSQCSVLGVITNGTLLVLLSLLVVP